MVVLESNIWTRRDWGGISYFRQASIADGGVYWEISISTWEREYCTVANIRSDAAEISLWKLKWNCPLMFYKHFFIEEIKINQKRRGILDSKICAEILQDMLEGYLPRICNRPSLWQNFLSVFFEVYMVWIQHEIKYLAITLRKKDNRFVKE